MEAHVNITTDVELTSADLEQIDWFISKFPRFTYDSDIGYYTTIFDNAYNRKICFYFSYGKLIKVHVSELSDNKNIQRDN